MGKYYVDKECDLQNNFPSAGAKTLRQMEVGETFQLLEGPKVEEAPEEYRIKVRCVGDGKMGWVTKKGGLLKTASTVYRCLDKAAMNDSMAGIEGSKVLKEL